MWRPMVRTRITLAALGLLVVFAGWVAWDVETEYGGNPVGGAEISNGVTRVFDVDEQSVDAEGHAVTTIVFEGTEAEAREFMEERWNEGRNYTIPVVIIALGGMLVLGAVFPPFGRKPEMQGENGMEGEA